MIEFALRMVTAGAGALIIVAVCALIEGIAPVERVSMRQRIRGAQMVFVTSSSAVLMGWLLQQGYGVVGLTGVVIPVGEWLAPFGLGGLVVNIALVLLLNDFFAYWRHRAEHRWFWPIHAVHHSPRELHAANNFGHPLQYVPGFIFQTIPVSLLQFTSPVIPVAVGMLAGIMEYLIHSPTDAHLGPIRRVIVDNRFHRIHHSREERHFDKNFGIMFSLWDGLFGTAHWPAKGEWPAVGIDQAPPENIGQYLAYPFKMLATAPEPEATRLSRDLEPDESLSIS